MQDLTARTHKMDNCVKQRSGSTVTQIQPGDVMNAPSQSSPGATTPIAKCTSPDNCIKSPPGGNMKSVSISSPSDFRTTGESNNVIQVHNEEKITHYERDTVTRSPPGGNMKSVSISSPGDFGRTGESNNVIPLHNDEKIIHWEWDTVTRGPPGGKLKSVSISSQRDFKKTGESRHLETEAKAPGNGKPPATPRNPLVEAVTKQLNVKVRAVYCNMNGLAKKSINSIENMLNNTEVDIFAVSEHKKGRKHDVPMFKLYDRWASCRENEQGGGRPFG